MSDANTALENVSDKIINMRSVNGVGLGTKWIDGQPTEQPAILVFVQKKMPKKDVLSAFSIDEVIPDSIDGIPTDVIEVGDIVAQGFNTRIRPIKPGYSTGHRNITAGTIGGFFYDKDNHPVVLSNNHVYANENKASAGDLIYQPGPYDSGKTNLDMVGWNNPTSSPYFATLKDFVAMNPQGNTQDSAIAKIHDSIIKAGMIDPIYPTINKPLTGFAQPTVNMQVHKAGRTTGYTTGRIMALNATFTVGYADGPKQFNSCVVCSAMSQGGDSGSLIMNMDMQAVALLFAGSDKVTIANPIQPVVQRYGLKLWQTVNQPNNSLELDDGKWTTATTNGTISVAKDSIIINSPANAYCFFQRELQSFKSVSVTVNTGSDLGASWGPGISIIWPNNNSLKVNLRRRGTYAGVLNGKEMLGVGKVLPNTEYRIRITRTNNTYVGEVQHLGNWATVITVPVSVFNSNPIYLTVGKQSRNGYTGNHSNLGNMGSCSFRDLDVVI